MGRRCVHCGYDISGEPPGVRCPECGRPGYDASEGRSGEWIGRGSVQRRVQIGWWLLGLSGLGAALLALWRYL